MLKYSKENISIKTIIVFIILVSTIIRTLIAYFIELGNDEVYYWTYAMFPSLSHFDHPPIVGLLIQSMTGNLILNNELAVRFSSILIGSINIWCMYVLGRRIKNELTGLYAALLYTASIYCSIIVGTFIMPDSPQSTFFLLSIYFIHEALINRYKGVDTEVKHLSNHALILVGLFIGLGILSKYTTLALWGSFGLYILIYKRSLLKNPYLYLAGIISILVMLPVIIWNYQNEFISFTFQGGRITSFGNLEPLYFGREIMGNIVYNNPINFIILIYALIEYKKNKYIQKDQFRLLLLIGLPILVTFLVISLFKPTLSHWSAPGYYSLMLISAAYLADKYKKRKVGSNIQDIGDSPIIPKSLKYALGLTIIIAIIGILQINFGIIINGSQDKNTEKLGYSDVSLDMYGWEQLEHEFREVRNNDLEMGYMQESAYMLSYKWYPAAHMDYYVANPNNMNLKTIGTLDQTHKYAWITEKRGGIKLGDNAYFIETSRYNFDGEDFGSKYFEKIELAKTIYIKRNNKDVIRYKVYRFINLDKLPAEELITVPLKSKDQ